MRSLTSKRNSNYAAYCFYINYLTKVFGIVFKPAFLNSYYQRFSLNKMTLRKITVDNSLKFIAQSDQTQSISKERERDTEPDTIKQNTSDRKFSQKNKKFIGKTGEGFKIFKG